MTKNLEAAYQLMWDVRLTQIVQNPTPPPTCPGSGDLHAYFSTFRPCVVGWYPYHIVVKPGNVHDPPVLSLEDPTVDYSVKQRVIDTLDDAVTLLQVVCVCH